MMNLILGGTGTVGSAVVNALLAKGEGVRVVTRSQDKVSRLPQGTVGVVGDLDDPSTFDNVFSQSYDNLFLLNSVSSTELQQGLAAVNEAKRTGAKRIVYLSVMNAEHGVHVPHFASKIAIENAIRQSGIPHVILRPNNFNQNDLWFQDAIVKHGVYPQPYGDKGCSRVDVRDVADAAVIALSRNDLVNKTFNLAGPRPVNGSATAEIWSSALGRKINYLGNDLDTWQTQALSMLPAAIVYDFRLMYAMFQAKGFVATDAQMKETRTILGREPRRFEDFVTETARTWR
jgi:uncharacterized protein YbjT (DUF2867 family)